GDHVRLLRTLAGNVPRRDLANVLSLPRINETGIDGSVLLFTLAIAVLTGLIFGLAPAVRHSRPHSMNLLHERSGSPSSVRNIPPLTDEGPADRASAPSP